MHKRLNYSRCIYGPLTQNRAYVAELYMRCTGNCRDGSSFTNPKKEKKKRKSWPPPPRGDFRKHAYLCMAKRGLYLSWNHCVCLQYFSHLKLRYADTHTNKRVFMCKFFLFWATYTCLGFFRFCITTDFATISHFNLHIFVTLWWKLHAFNRKCTIVHFLTANQMD